MQYPGLYKSKLILAGALAITVSACGGGGSDNDNADAQDSTPATTTPAEGTITETALLTGRFVDSPVSGLSYVTESRSGVTDADGSFSYEAGESVTFSLGDITLPTVDAASIVTPLTVFSTSNIADAQVINLTRLLQSLDADGTPENGIVLADSAIASATGLSVDFAAADFDNQVVNLVANSGSVTTALIDGESALDHFQETLFNEGIQERPEAPSEPVDTTPDPDNTSTSPLIGTSAEFSDFAHDIGGTLTVIDDRTLQITNFTYDGGGPSVLFYLGTDGAYSLSQGGIPIGQNINGRPFNGETINLTLPPGVTLNDFNGVSVWCDIFNVNFGDAQF